jgi:hypothetical protein
MVTQSQQVFDAMRLLGGYATLGKLYSVMDFSAWKTKTPQASVRRIVQNCPGIFKVQPGLWALEESRENVLRLLGLSNGSSTKTKDEFGHSYYQGLVVEIGNLRHLGTYVPAQDKSKYFLDQKLSEIISVETFIDFGRIEITRFAKTVDVIWYNNERRMPKAFFEIEHSTDFFNSISKFYELQDYYAKFNIVAAEHRRRQFDDIIDRSMFAEIRDRVRFVDYEAVAKMYSDSLIRHEVGAL